MDRCRYRAREGEGERIGLSPFARKRLGRVSRNGQGLPACDGPGALSCVRVIEHTRKQPAQLDCGRELAVLLEDDADRGGICLSANEHTNRMEKAGLRAASTCRDGPHCVVAAGCAPARRSAAGLPQQRRHPRCRMPPPAASPSTLGGRVLIAVLGSARLRAARGVGEPHQPPSKITQEVSNEFRPLHDRVVVRRLEAEEKTAGGIIIPDTAKEKPMEGEVIAVGPGARDEAGKLVPLDVKANDRILFGKWSGTEVKLDGEELLIVKESDIMGIIEGQPAAKRKAA